ncbi:MAG: hypothetical protein WDM86_07570 [Rhizomicrobium sp.]
MPKNIRLAAISLVAAAAALLGSSDDTVVTPALAQTSSACTIPAKPAATPDQTAWELFVAVNCRAPNGKLVWENWIEQAQLYPASGAPGALAVAGRRLHGSALAALLHPASGIKGVTAAATPGPCNKMSIVPSNVTSGATICEEVHINPSAQATIQKNGYQYRTGQMAAAAAGTKISFGTDAIEVKIDWLPTSDFASPSFSCTKPTPTVYVETIDGICYAMVAMHVTSHLLPNWLWTTFEPQNVQTNPFRCAVYGPCLDKWGATPSVAVGASSITTLTPALAALIKQANLPMGFANYRLVGAQTDFTAGGRAILNGNSITEYEAAGTPAGESSCISCHSMSSINASGVDGASFFATDSAPIGLAVSLPVGFITRGFLWSLALACPNPTNTGFQPCTAPPPKKSP